MNTATFDFIRQHASDDVRQLALHGAPAEVDLHIALQQIEGRQLAARKLPACAATDGLLFPPRLSLEQCSSEATAAYKRRIIERFLSVPSSDPHLSSLFIDLTAGFGIDFAALAPLFSRSLYVDSNPVLCDLARHNLPLLGLPTADVRCSTAEAVLSEGFHADLLFVDPARRDAAGRKVALIEDCTPDVCALQALLRASARFTLIKLSPMLDLSAALRALQGITEVHVVSVGGECKELLLLMSPSATVPASPTIHCIDLSATTSSSAMALTSFSADTFCFTRAEEAAAPLVLADSIGAFVFEPNASILKAGAFRILCERYPVRKLSADAHLYTADAIVPDFPGRAWRVCAHSSFNKRELRTFLGDTRAAELSVRGFPLSVAALRKQLHLSEGGQAHFIATTLADGQRRLLRVERCLHTSDNLQ